MKRLLFVPAGLAYGFLSFLWVAFSLVLILHPFAEPGTKEWPEDSSLIPFGYAGFLLWAALTGYLFWKLRKDKRNALLFFGTAVLAGGAALAVLYFR